jgi:hypothetical protein
MVGLIQAHMVRPHMWALLSATNYYPSDMDNSLPESKKAVGRSIQQLSANRI